MSWVAATRLETRIAGGVGRSGDLDDRVGVERRRRSTRTSYACARTRRTRSGGSGGEARIDADRGGSSSSPPSSAKTTPLNGTTPAIETLLELQREEIVELGVLERGRAELAERQGARVVGPSVGEPSAAHRDDGAARRDRATKTRDRLARIVSSARSGTTARSKAPSRTSRSSTSGRTVTPARSRRAAFARAGGIGVEDVDAARAELEQAISDRALASPRTDACASAASGSA